MINLNDGWIEVERPGYAGKHRDARHAGYDQVYGQGNWQTVWVWRGIWLERVEAYMLYEDAYYHHFQAHTEELSLLISDAKDVYDDAPSNVVSGLDYLCQETNRTHLQDIAIRRALIRLGLWFNGRYLVRIRDARGSHPLSLALSPGRVQFHLPGLIRRPELEGWWQPGSVESFYQSNKVLLVRPRG